MAIIFHTILLLLSFGFAYVCAFASIGNQISLSSYTIPIIGLLVFGYLLISYIRKRFFNNKLGFKSWIDIIILNTVILLLIQSTGELYSPLFFLLYFLGFGITFVFEPPIIFVFIIAAILLFLPEAFKNQSLESFLRLGSLFLISPLAYFFGQEYKEKEKEKEKIENLKNEIKNTTETIENEASEILKNEKDSIEQDTTKKIINIISKTKKLEEINNEV